MAETGKWLKEVRESSLLEEYVKPLGEHTTTSNQPTISKETQIGMILYYN